MKSLTFIEIDNTSSARAVSIPDPAVVGHGAEALVKDGSGGAATHNITITPLGGTIDGQPNYVISDNGACIMMRSDGAKWVVVSTFGVTVGAPAVAAPSYFGGFLTGTTDGSGNSQTFTKNLIISAGPAASQNRHGGIVLPAGTLKKIRAKLSTSDSLNIDGAISWSVTVDKNNSGSALSITGTSVAALLAGIDSAGASLVISAFDNIQLIASITLKDNLAGGGTVALDLIASVEFTPA